MKIRRCLSVLLLVATVSTASAGIAGAQVPDEVLPCIPAGAVQVQLRGSTNRDDLSYYYVIGVDPAKSVPFVAIARVDLSDRCEVLLDGSDITQSLDNVMPFEVALELYHQNYKLAIELAGSQEALEDIFAQSAEGDTVTYRSEAEVTALQELGVDFPDLYTLTSANPNVRALVDVFLRFNDPPGSKSVNRVEIVGDFAIASWFQRAGASGHYVGQQVGGEWQALGFTNNSEGPFTAEILRDRFGIPIEIVRQLLEASASS